MVTKKIVPRVGLSVLGLFYIYIFRRKDLAGEAIGTRRRMEGRSEMDRQYINYFAP